MPLMSIFDGPFCKKNIFALCFQACCCGVFFHLEFQKWKNLIMMIYCMLVRVLARACSQCHSQVLKNWTQVFLDRKKDGQRKIAHHFQTSSNYCNMALSTATYTYIQAGVDQFYDLSGPKKKYCSPPSLHLKCQANLSSRCVYIQFRQ